jgi:hypothetical protein
MTAHSSFREIVADARRKVPGGHFTAADMQGLIRRARAMEIDREEAAEIILARPRHPITRGIE